MKNRLPKKNLKFFEASLLLFYGVYCLYLYFSGKITFFVHPDYAFLALFSGIFLVLFAVGLSVSSFSSHADCHDCHQALHNFKSWQSFYSWALIIFPLVLTLFFQPKPLSSAIASTRSTGLYTDAGLSREAVVFSGFAIDTEKRSLVDWIRLFSQDPEPDHYKGMKAKLVGFVMRDQTLPENYFTLARFVISCCAADARPIGIPVKYDAEKIQLKDDQWIELQGYFDVSEIEGQRQPVLILDSYKEVDIPQNPYAT